MSTSLKDAGVGPHRSPAPLPTSSRVSLPALELKRRKHPCPKGFSHGTAGSETWSSSRRALAGFVHHVSPRRVSEAPYLRVYGCHTPATVLGSHQHPESGTQQVAGGWQGKELAGTRGGLELPMAPGCGRIRAGMQLITPWAGFCPDAQRDGGCQHPSRTGTHL